jgi:hypothetical protein
MWLCTPHAYGMDSSTLCPVCYLWQVTSGSQGIHKRPGTCVARICFKGHIQPLALMRDTLTALINGPPLLSWAWQPPLRKTPVCHRLLDTVY